MPGRTAIPGRPPGAEASFPRPGSSLTARMSDEGRTLGGDSSGSSGREGKRAKPGRKGPDFGRQSRPIYSDGGLTEEQVGLRRDVFMHVDELAMERASRGRPPRAAAVAPRHSTGQASPDQEGRWFGDRLGLDRRNIDPSRANFTRDDILPRSGVKIDPETLRGIDTARLEVGDRKLQLGVRTRTG